MSVSGGSATEATISGLTPSTTYSIEVATVNSAGIGVYSDPPVIVETPLGKCLCPRPNEVIQKMFTHETETGSVLITFFSEHFLEIQSSFYTSAYYK